MDKFPFCHKFWPVETKKTTCKGRWSVRCSCTFHFTLNVVLSFFYRHSTLYTISNLNGVWITRWRKWWACCFYKRKRRFNFLTQFNIKCQTQTFLETLNTHTTHGATPYESSNPLAANKPWTTKTEYQTANK